MYKIGQRVKILNNGLTYTTYSDMFRKFKFKNTEINWEFPDKSTAIIFNMGILDSTGKDVLCLRNEIGQECLIEENAVCLYDDESLENDLYEYSNI